MPFVRTRLAFTVATALTALLGGFTPSADAAAPPGPVTVPGSHPDHLTAAEDAGRIPTTTNLTARLYLGTRDPNGLHTFLTAVTTPTSPHYRHFLTPAQYERRFGLTPSARNRITRWLTSAHLRITEDTPHYLQLIGSEAHFATALGTDIHRYDTSAGTIQAPVDDMPRPRLAGPRREDCGRPLLQPAGRRPLPRPHRASPGRLSNRLLRLLRRTAHHQAPQGIRKNADLRPPAPTPRPCCAAPPV